MIDDVPPLAFSSWADLQTPAILSSSSKETVFHAVPSAAVIFSFSLLQYAMKYWTE